MHARCSRHIMVILASGFHSLQQSGVCAAHYQPKGMQLYSGLLNVEAWPSGWGKEREKKQQHPLCPLSIRMEALPIRICLSDVTINRRHLSVISVWFQGWTRETTSRACFPFILSLLCHWMLSLHKHVNRQLFTGSFLILIFVMSVVPQPNSDSRRLTRICARHLHGK